MDSIQNIIINQDISIRDALKIIDKSSKQICLVVENEKLIGTLTDGDIRRGFLDGLGLDSPIKSIVFKTPTTCSAEDSREKILKIAITNKLHQIPIVDNKGRLVGLKEIDELLKPKSRTNSVVLMVGGLGTRLMPLTEDTPKPMLEVGGKPILQTIVEGFAKHGFTNITMCLGYKSNVIQDFFKDGKAFEVNIDYIVEEKRMGTAGALTLLKKEFNEPFFVMNGDLLTNINYERMLDFHQENNSKATMCVREYEIEVPYGVVKTNIENIVSIEEKPVHNFYVNAGVYLLEPDCIDLIPRDEFYDMPSMFEKLIDIKEKTVSFPLKNYWLDIGRLEDFKKANIDYQGVF
jgi:dTDP-glucose pyrophosphorylase